MTKIPKWLYISFLFISFIGFLDATYITAKHYLGIPITCSILNGCEQVTTSVYATFFDVPVALIGAVYYLAIFALVVLYLDTKKEYVFYSASKITILGFIASIWFVYLQVFVLKALCLYCLASAVTSTILFILAIMTLRLNK
ncbi:MAG: vitamin K epoxide reductase family protein [Patescibacteria group bacterium]